MEFYIYLAVRVHIHTVCLEEIIATKFFTVASYIHKPELLQIIVAVLYVS